jgi:phosphoglycerate dehydrogenase-like enzyme
MLVVGLGGIGTEVARRAHGFGMRVIATRRQGTPGPEFVERVGTPQDLHAMLPEADVVAICLPLTDETQGLFDDEAFAAMKDGAYLINVGRGRVVDTAALLRALDGGRMAGACLDVVDPEPLPADHPLWRHPKVLITPHVSSDAELTDRRRWDLMRENLRRFSAGEPLLNVVDKQAGY